MAGYTASHAGSQVVTVPGFAHPRPTVKVGGDKRRVFLRVQSKEVGSNVFPGLEEGLPAVEHTGDRPASSEVGRDGRCRTRLDSRRGGEDVH